MGQQKKQHRRAFREAVLQRDGHRCRVCGRDDTKLDAHHITDRNEMPDGGYVPENGITLCDPPEGDSCHFKAEVWHKSAGAAFFGGFTPDELYEIIGSSHEKALAVLQNGQI